MKKVILGVFLVVLIVIGAGVYYIYSNLDNLVKVAIEKYGSEVTQTTVKVDKVKLELKKGSASIYGISIANLTGFTDPEIFSLGEINVTLDLQRLSEELIVIDNFSVIAPKVFFEMNTSNKANLYELTDRIKQTMPVSSSAQDKPAATAKLGKEPKLIIRHVKFAEGNIQARVAAMDNKVYQLKLPQLEMENLGGKNGAAASVIAKQLLGKLSEQATAAIKQQGLDKELAKLKAQVNEKIESEKAKLESKASQQLDAEKQKAANKLKSLIPK